MARKRRDTDAFSMAFLDIMSCGFGAIILFFVLIQHASVQTTRAETSDTIGEVNRLETEVALEELNKVILKNTIEELDEEIISSEDEAGRVMEMLSLDEDSLTEQKLDAAARREHLNQLVADIQSLEEEINRVNAEQEEAGAANRVFYGDGDRQYLTGLKIGGKRILMLLDSSTSMLDGTLVNVIRRKYLPDDVKIRSEKWQKALLTLDWITTQLPESARFQFYDFNITAQSVVEVTDVEWLEVGDGQKLDEAVAGARRIVPGGGTRMHAVVEAINSLSPKPDNVFLILDGLPTQGAVPDSAFGSVRSKRREEYFRDAISQIPLGVPINVILMPMEGDPMAASNLWKLAVSTGGSFMSPSRDWP